ncbi:CUB domain-containing protein [Aquimarina sp. Aq78]|uniref:CUB domain-containing protein n=1 Tax=Aquimarina sp. Aq78 TaxID=1191889 RepID=UPI000D10FA40|nr:CUB domain-containing protein [Aquimarina sp. Aq78]
MKKRMIRPVLLGLGLVTLSVLVVNSVKKDNLEQSTNETEITNLRKQHASYLKNSPYKETLKLTKSERKAKGLPPNKYFEQMWELTINPATGKTEPEKIYAVQKQLANTSKRAPGDAQNNPWVERGPNDIGGRTRAILFDPNDANNRRVYAGGVSGGLWVNNDITSAASQWSRVQNVPGNLSVTSITVDPRNSNTWYVGTGEQYTAGDVVGSGVYQSTDGGTTWQAVNIPPAGGGNINFNASNLFLSGIYYVNDIVAWNNTAQNRTELFVGVGAHVYGDSSGPANWLGIQSAGIYRSIDGGANWNRVESANMQYQRNNVNYYYVPNDFEVGANNRLWVGTINSPLGNGGGRVYSSDDGATWTEAAASPLNDSNRVELEASETNANKIYALTQGVARDANDKVIDPVHVYRSLDGFATAPTATALPNDVDNGIPAKDFTRGQAFYDLMIESDPNNDDIVYVGGIDLFRSTNSGNAWSQISKWSNNNNLAGLGASIVHADQHAMAFRPGNSNQAIFGNDGGIFYANSLSTAANNNVFGARNNNYNVTQYVKAGIGPNGVGDINGIFSAGAQDNGSQAFRNVAPGINGSEPLTGGDGFYTFVDKDGQYMIATYVRNVIYRFNLPWDGRSRIQGGATTLVDDDSSGDFVNQMGYDSDANFLLSNNTHRVNNNTVYSIKTIDVARDRNADITNALLTSKPTAFIASSFANNTWYVGTASGGLLRLTNVGLGAANWAEINTPFVGSVSSVRLGATANDIMVTIHNYGVTSIWYSSDAGVNWSSKEGDLPDIPVRDILQNPLDRTEVIVGTQLGVWVTTNFDAANPNWIRSQNGMSDASVTSFDYWEVNGDQNNNKIIASTYGRGVFTGSFTANGAQDNEAPTAPTNLVASNITQTTIDLGWTASNDNVGVTEYDVYQDGVVIATINATNRTVTGLTANTSYAFKVRAKDAAGNVSADSNIINTTTSAAAADPCNGGATLTANSGNFEDGSGAQNYANNRNCTWLIKPGNGGTVTLNFDSYNTESNYDFVTVYDGENANATQLGRFSGAAVPNQIVSTGNAMFVRFTSDGSVTATGWAARYTSTVQGVPTCNDGIQNGNETGVDCGGDCAPCNVVDPGCANGISAFPYNEGFEASLGGWTQGAGDDFDWTRQSGGTRSRDTGPSGAQEGSQYVYVETSVPNSPNKTTILNSPCFNLNGVNSPSFAFRYHMLGNAVGELKLEISDDDGANWASIWSKTGAQGNVWNNANVDLNTYVGRSIKIRFVGTSGNSWQGDMAVDNISLTTSNAGAVADRSTGGLTDLTLNNQESKVFDVSFYPNPVEGIMYINATKTTSLVNYRIMNITGQIVNQGVIQNNSIDLQNLTKGVYILELKSEKNKTIKQFIKK